MEQNTPESGALINGAYTKDRTRLREYLQAGNIIREGDMRMISDPERLPALERKREGAHGLIIDSIEFQSAFFGALSNAQTIRKGKRKGKRRHPGGSAAGSMNSDDYIFSIKIQSKWAPCHFCEKTNFEGTHKSQHCFKWLVGWTNGRIGTEVCRLESTAKATKGVFALDRYLRSTRRLIREEPGEATVRQSKTPQPHMPEGMPNLDSNRFKTELNVTPTTCSMLPGLRSPLTVVNFWRSSQSVSLRISGCHATIVKSNWEQVSSQGLCLCPTRVVTFENPLMSPKRPTLLTMQGSFHCPSLQFSRWSS